MRSDLKRQRVTDGQQSGSQMVSVPQINMADQTIAPPPSSPVLIELLAPDLSSKPRLVTEAKAEEWSGEWRGAPVRLLDNRTDRPEEDAQ